MDYTNLNDYWMKPNEDPYKGLNDDERLKVALTHLLVFIGCLLIGFAICALMGSCTTTEYVTIVEHHTDTLYKNIVQRDSVYLKDSTHVSEKNDTVKIEHWRTKIVKNEVHDTTYISKTDSVPAPYPVEVIQEVPAQLTWWQQTRLHLANILLWTVLLVLIIYIAKRLLNHKLTRM